MNTADKNKAWALLAHHEYAMETVSAMSALTAHIATSWGHRTARAAVAQAQGELTK